MQNLVGKIVFLERTARYSDYDGEFAVVKQDGNTIFAIPLTGHTGYGINFPLKTISIVEREGYNPKEKDGYGDYSAFLISVRENTGELLNLLSEMRLYSEGKKYEHEPNGKDGNNAGYRRTAAINSRLLELALGEYVGAECSKLMVNSHARPEYSSDSMFPLHYVSDGATVTGCTTAKIAESKLVTRWHILVTDGGKCDIVKYRASLLHAPSEAELLEHLTLGIKEGGSQIRVYQAGELRKQPKHSIGDVFLYNSLKHRVVGANVMNNEEVVYTIEVQNDDGSVSDIRTIKEPALEAAKKLKGSM